MVKHQQILDKLALGAIPALVQDEVHLLAMRSYYEARLHGQQGARYDDVVPPLLRRWQSLLEAQTTDQARWEGHRLALALATCLHRVGLADDAVTRRAVEGISELNAHVVLSDAFERQSPEIVRLLMSEPAALTRAPSPRPPFTAARAGDLLAIRRDERWVMAHVHADTGLNEIPIVELYERTFAEVPAPEHVVGSRALGRQLGEGPRRANRVAVAGLRHLPDPAGQFVLVAAGVTTAPETAHLAPAMGLWEHATLFEFLEGDVAHAVAEGTS